MGSHKSRILIGFLIAFCHVSPALAQADDWSEREAILTGAKGVLKRRLLLESENAARYPLTTEKVKGTDQMGLSRVESGKEVCTSSELNSDNAELVRRSLIEIAARSRECNVRIGADADSLKVKVVSARLVEGIFETFPTLVFSVKGDTNVELCGIDSELAPEKMVSVRLSSAETSYDGKPFQSLLITDATVASQGRLALQSSLRTWTTVNGVLVDSLGQCGQKID